MGTAGLPAHFPFLSKIYWGPSIGGPGLLDQLSALTSKLQVTALLPADRSPSISSCFILPSKFPCDLIWIAASYTVLSNLDSVLALHHSKISKYYRD